MNNSTSPDSISSLVPLEHLSIWREPAKDPIGRIELTGKCIDELVAAAGKTTDTTFTDFPRDKMATCCELVQEVRSALLSRSGAVLIDRYPVEDHDLPTTKRAAGILANLIAPLMTQDIKGTLLYDVIDEKTQSSNTTRRSKTNVEQPFHTDGPWLKTPANFIGLFCVQPAKQGGFSQVSSLQNALDKIKPLSTQQSSIRQDLYWNKMGQFAENERSYSQLPILSNHDNGPRIRHYADYVRTGHELADEHIPEDVSVLLSEIDRVLQENACSPFRLEAGQFQYVNNWTVAHARAGFDDPDTQSGRHLIRLWNNEIPGMSS